MLIAAEGMLQNYNKKVTELSSFEIQMALFDTSFSQRLLLQSVISNRFNSAYERLSDRPVSTLSEKKERKKKLKYC